MFGRKAGSLTDYPYSEGLKQSGIVWDEASLDKWLSDPQAFVPGAKMFYHLVRGAGPRRRYRVPERARALSSSQPCIDKGCRAMTSEAARRRFRDVVMPHLDDAYSLAKWLSGESRRRRGHRAGGGDARSERAGAANVDNPRAWFLRIVRNTALTWMAKNRSKSLSFAGDMTDLELERGSSRFPSRPRTPKKS